MKEIIEVFRMDELSPKMRAKLIIKLGIVINNTHGSNITEPIVYEVKHLMKSDCDGLWAKARRKDIIEDKDVIIDIQPEDISVMQFTGLKDSKGTEIYEGDILKETELFEVIWDATWCKFKLDHSRVSRFIQYPEWNRGAKMEIIGNIHQNPGLLTNG